MELRRKATGSNERASAIVKAGKYDAKWSQPASLRVEH
jgi:hypothetical protein